MADGTIVQPSRESLLAVGAWLSFSCVHNFIIFSENQCLWALFCSGDAIYDSQFWYVTAEENDLRFVSSLPFPPMNGRFYCRVPALSDDET